MDSTRDLSVGDLLDQLLSDELIDACHITGDYVTIVQGTKRHSFPYRQARTFLMGMLRGRSWNVKAADGEADSGMTTLRAIEKRREDVGVALEAAAAQIEEAGRFEGAAVEPREEAPPRARQFVRALGPALDEMLAMAVEMELIESFSKDEPAQTVTIVLSACQTQMQFDEAVVFLTECILYKLNSIREEVHRLSREYGGADGQADSRSDTSGRTADGRADFDGESAVRSRVAGDQPVWVPLA